MYRLDKSAFSVKNQTQEPKSSDYWLNKKPEERLKAAWYLILSAYNFSETDQPRLDRMVFNIKSRDV